MRWLMGASALFPPLRLASSSDKALKALGIAPDRYMGMVASLSVVGAILSLIVSLFFGFPVFMALLASSVFSSLLIFLPRMELKKRADEISCSMPFFLRAAGMLLEMGLPFRKALEAAAQGEGALAEEMKGLLREADDGLPLQKALSSLAVVFGSLPVKRAVSQMITAYETGSSGADMRKIGDELLSMERHRLKEHAAKSALFGLMFVISSAVMPTFFMVYAIAGGREVSRLEMSIAMLVVFPAIGVLILLLSKAMMPRSVFSGHRPGAGLLLPCAGFVALFVLFPSLQMVLLVLGAAGGSAMAWRSYSAEKRLEDMESALPDALFCAAGMPKSARPERVLAVIRDGDFGALSEEAERSRRQMEMNVSAGAALEDMATRNRSPMMERACRMLIRMVETSSLDRLNGLAEDMINAFQEKRERGQLFSMQKYTLVLGALLMPLIMKMALGLLSQMGEMLGEHAAQAGEICASLAPPYIVIYGMISGMAIADAEGKGSSLGIYTLGLSAVGLLAFQFINF